MTRLDIDPRFAAAHYQDGRDLHGDAQQPSVHSVAGDLHPSSTVRTTCEGWQPIASAPTVCRYADWCNEEGRCANGCEDRAPVAYLRSITHPDWLEVCDRDSQGAFPVYAAAPTPQVEGVSVPPEVAGQRQQPNQHDVNSVSGEHHPLPSVRTGDEVAPQAAQPVAPHITFAHEVDGPWRLELNGVTLSRHDTREALEQAIASLRLALAAAVQPVAQEDGYDWKTIAEHYEAALRHLAENAFASKDWRYARDALQAKESAAKIAVQPVAQQQPSVHQVVGSGLPSQAVRTGDEELLARAAEVAGIELHEKPFFTNALTMKHGGGVLPWNPLRSDGDALRLAVKCGFIIDTLADVRARFDTDEPATMVVFPRPSEQSVGEWHQDSDPRAATRRAIVRAAAQLARPSVPTEASSGATGQDEHEPGAMNAQPAGEQP